MQQTNKIRKFFRDKGFYMALGLCALAVGISGWLFVRETGKQTQQALSPTQIQAAAPARERDPAAHLPVFEHEGEDGVSEPGQKRPEGSAGTDLTEEKAPEGPAGTDTKEATAPGGKEPVRTTLAAVAPLEGERGPGYSMDRLSYNPTTRDWRTHAGIDILAPLGTDVGAAAAGVVLSVYDDDLLGRTVTVRHDGGWVTHYSNLAEEVDVMAGDRVAAGQCLGQVGTTALLEVGQEAHLHFAVYRNNVPQDPEEFLKNGG
jgi:murein DD-endopeptidase MepM/ murein hydrolase activator NlpD